MKLFFFICILLFVKPAFATNEIEPVCADIKLFYLKNSLFVRAPAVVAGCAGDIAFYPIGAIYGAVTGVGFLGPIFGKFGNGLANTIFGFPFFLIEEAVISPFDNNTSKSSSKNNDDIIPPKEK